MGWQDIDLFEMESSGFSEEGGYSRPSGRFRAFGSLPRPESWFPYVFTSIHDPQLNQFLHSN